VQNWRLDCLVKVATLDTSQRKWAGILCRFSGDDLSCHPEPPKYSFIDFRFVNLYKMNKMLYLLYCIDQNDINKENIS